MKLISIMYKKKNLSLGPVPSLANLARFYYNKKQQHTERRTQ